MDQAVAKPESSQTSALPVLLSEALEHRQAVGAIPNSHAALSQQHLPAFELQQSISLSSAQEAQIIGVGTQAFLNEFGNQGTQIAVGVAEGAQQLVDGMTDLCVKVSKASIADTAKHFADAITAAYGAADKYGRKVSAGKANPLDDAEHAIQGAYESWDHLPTKQKAAAGTEIVLSCIPIEGAVLGGKALFDVVRDSELTGDAARAVHGLLEVTTDLKAVPRPAGAGGSWRVLNERQAADVVQQTHAWSCVHAVGEMLADGKVSQGDLLDKLPIPADCESLAEGLGPGWKGGGVVSSPEKIDKILDTLMHRSPWAAELREPKGRGLGHLVVVDGLDAAGDIMIRDPAHGTRYEMTKADFLRAWKYQRLVYRK